MDAPILAAQPITFRYRGQAQTQLGFSAEDLHAIDPLLVNLDADGRPDSIRVQAFLAHLLEALRAIDKRLAVLEKNLS